MIRLNFLTPPPGSVSYRVVVVDDEELARRRLRTLLGRCGEQWEVVGEAGDGLSAVALIEQCSPDIVLLDIEMPGIDGLEVARRRSRGPFLIFVTAHADYALEAFKAMAVDYLRKPVQEEALRGGG